MKLGIVGGGGIGSYYGGLLSRAGQDVVLFTRGDHLSAVRARGLEVRTPESTFTTTPHATDDAGALTGSEFVLVAVKGYSLPDVRDAVVRAARSGSAIVPLLNGVDVPERLEALGVPRASILGGLVTASLFRTAPGVVERRSPFDRVVIGELGGATSDRVSRIVGALSAAGVAARASDNIRHDLWRKFAFIVPITIASGLSRRPIGAMLATERGRRLVTDALHEIVLVSATSATPLSQDDELAVARDLLALLPQMRPSFLADLERGGPAETDLLAGTVARLGREHGIATPIHDVATAAFEAATRALD
jgi:2-dehydropantoate 2-reductase